MGQQHKKTTKFAADSADSPTELALRIEERLASGWQLDKVWSSSASQHHALFRRVELEEIPADPDAKAPDTCATNKQPA